MDHRDQQFERSISIAAEHCDAALLITTYVDDEGNTQTYITSRGNALTVEGLIHELIQEQEDEAAESDEDE